METGGRSNASFDLEVTFTGLCLFTKGDDGEALVVLPDARNPDRFDNGRKRQALDGMPLDWHVGYLSIPTAHLADGVPGETVIRFDRDCLVFDGVEGDGPDPAGLVDVADLTRVVDTAIRVDETARSRTGPSEYVLAHAHLSGGSYRTRCNEDEVWCFSRQLRPGTANYSGKLAHTVIWSVDGIPGDGLDLSVLDLDSGRPKHRLRLSPTGKEGRRRIELKVANLCHSNPLEWEEIPHRSDSHHDREDPDFRWYYPLLGADVTRELHGYLLPVPLRRPTIGGAQSNCLPAQFGP